MTTLTLRPPLHIGPRLMPAVRIGDRSTIHISPTRRDADGRVVWRYIIEDHDRHVLDDATDLRSGTGDEIDPNKAMATLLGFLTAAAEAFRHALNGGHGENADLFPPDVTEWAYEHDDEIAALALELTEADTPADPNTLWHQVWTDTGCADCAGAAAQGRPWGPDHCWATHRPHTPIADADDEGGNQ